MNSNPRSWEKTYPCEGVQRVRDQIVENIREMLVPLQVRDTIASPNGSPQAPGYEQRLEALVAEAPPLAEDRITGASIDRRFPRPGKQSILGRLS
jgi:hypothetical protein